MLATWGEATVPGLEFGGGAQSVGPRAPYGQAHPGGGQAHPGGRQGPTANAACLASWPWDPGPMQCVHPSPCLFLVSCCLQMAPCPKCCLVQDAPKQELHPAALVAKSLRYRGPWGTLRLQGASGPPPLPAHLSIRTNGWHALGENALRLVPADRAAEHRHWRDSRRRSQL